ncbi:GNAT family N-acetyltransferase [Bacillus spizizenii]|uniref:Putative acetyltransferase n=1 Tax=Bacillus spizizenii (strain ATCC 23059 / NRRL B-14472 / W23) TaxID=655816 RepID=E0U4C9_BACSH|nr:GNAT family N-acetyltransferase [Bacillus spizizenii]QCJ15894.1 GNAT family N-acetyltransferase [Bacillus subtilis]ADM36587.1 putative acetyltransferase [Bacillus spizizenii str. W23]EFG91047.1 putative acetyltransferase [Bacillus spizizenii ATCC 6633 = JCM 2499]MBE0174030.1 GNAT family N-acetyltransferase [Bacillus spizizenii]MBT3130950.1 GNAT family N-acetyltransferase [Bacillus spizizenii]
MKGVVNLQELTKEKYNGLKTLIDETFCPTFVYSILEQTIPGVVYVDDQTFPRSFFIGTESGIYFIAGDQGNRAFNDFIAGYYEEQAKSTKRFTLFSSNDIWDRVMKTILKDELNQMKRVAFSFQQKSSITELQLPKGFVLKRIDEDIILNSTEFNKAYYEEYWDSVSYFSSKGFGFAILHGNHVVSECTSIFLGHHRAEMDIYTLEEYRGMGLAYCVASEFIEYCLKNGIIPSWDCDVCNNSSITLAAKLGFKKIIEYSIFYSGKS